MDSKAGSVYSATVVSCSITLWILVEPEIPMGALAMHSPCLFPVGTGMHSQMGLGPECQLVTMQVRAFSLSAKSLPGVKVPIGGPWKFCFLELAVYSK